MKFLIPFACVLICGLNYVNLTHRACVEGTFGINCRQVCHCHNSKTCDKVTGTCADGNCAFGWKGKNCNTSTIISQGKSVTMSSQFEAWKAVRAVDGDITTTPNNCKCCAATKYEDYPWFEIDLGMPFRIAYIIIYGRTDKDEQYHTFYGLRIFAGKHDNATDLIYSFYKNKYFLNVTLDMPVITRYITLTQGRSRLMIICELQLLEGECDDGNFGRLCNNSCYCLGPPCNKETGECPSTECQPGYQENTCSEECGDGRFGSECSETCGFCFNSTACDKVEGNCTSCDPGYIGQRCKQRTDEHSGDEFGLSSGSLIAILCSTFLVILVVLVIAIILCRRSSTVNDNKPNENELYVNAGPGMIGLDTVQGLRSDDTDASAYEAVPSRNVDEHEYDILSGGKGAAI